LDKKLKVAVVGLTVGGSHVNNYVASKNVSEVVICDTNTEKLNSVGDKHGISKRYLNYEQMLAEEKPDAVSVAAPNFLHLPFAVKAMEAGAHVLTEKPMACNADEARLMYECAQRTGKKLMINFNQRFQKDVRALKSIIDDGKLGEIYYVRTLWQRVRGVPWWYPLANGKDACGGGSLIDLGVHVLDRAMWLCGFPEPEWVLGNAYNKLSAEEAAQKGISFEIDDMAVAMFRMKNGSMLQLESSWAANRENEVVMTRIYGTKGGAVLQNIVKPERIDSGKLFLEANGTVEEFDVHEYASDVPGENIRQAFLDAIVNDTEVPCTALQGITINHMLDAVYESAKTGAPVQF